MAYRGDADHGDGDDDAMTKQLSKRYKGDKNFMNYQAENIAKKAHLSFYVSPDPKQPVVIIYYRNAIDEHCEGELVPFGESCTFR